MTTISPEDVMDTIHVFRQQPKAYTFVPQPDLTPIEAVWIAHLFAFVVKSHLDLDTSPQWEIIKRHFQETPDLSK